jgi:hypothetical protein
MTIKLLLLKSGEDVIADITEMGTGDEKDRRVVGYFLNKPCIIKMRDPSVLTEEPDGPTKAGFAVSLYPWMPLSKEETIPIAADWLITMVEPIDKLKQMYVEDIVNHGSSNKDSSTVKQSDSD